MQNANGVTNTTPSRVESVSLRTEWPEKERFSAEIFQLALERQITEQ